MKNGSSRYGAADWTCAAEIQFQNWTHPYNSLILVPSLKADNATNSA